MSVLELFLLEIFRNSFYCHLLFNYQCSLLSRDNFLRISDVFLLVNNFLKLFLKSGERGIWTLAPVARPTPLAGAPLRPLEYFSELVLHMIFYTALSQCKSYYTKRFFSCQPVFLFFSPHENLSRICNTYHTKKVCWAHSQLPCPSFLRGKLKMFLDIKTTILFRDVQIISKLSGSIMF